jgi:hypothetical protein
MKRTINSKLIKWKTQTFQKSIVTQTREKERLTTLRRHCGKIIKIVLKKLVRNNPYLASFFYFKGFNRYFINN